MGRKETLKKYNNKPERVEHMKRYRSERKDLPGWQHRVRFNGLNRRYGVDEHIWQRIIERQGYVCAACGKSFVGKRIVVEHDHKTDKVRSITHQHCNMKIAWMENYGLAYLEKYG